MTSYDVIDSVCFVTSWEVLLDFRLFVQILEKQKVKKMNVSGWLNRSARLWFEGTASAADFVSVTDRVRPILRVLSPLRDFRVAIYYESCL